MKMVAIMSVIIVAAAVAVMDIIAVITIAVKKESVIMWGNQGELLSYCLSWFSALKVNHFCWSFYENS